jgi:hypothetical protein
MRSIFVFALVAAILASSMIVSAHKEKKKHHSKHGEHKTEDVAECDHAMVCIVSPRLCDPVPRGRTQAGCGFVCGY